MKVLFIPTVRENPYQSLLAAALAENGIDVSFSYRFPKCGWLWENRENVNIIHVHWPSDLYRLGCFTPLRMLLFIVRFYFARFLRIRVVWTAHNLLPHEKTLFGYADVLIRRLLVHWGDGVIVHCRQALREVIKMFGSPKRIIVIPHGNFVGYYPVPPDRVTARSKLGLSSGDFVLLCFGRLRKYKGFSELIEQFQRLEKPATLIIAGAGDDAEVDRLLSNVKDADIRIYAEYVPDEDLPYFFAAADGMVVSYNKILTSGAAILGLSMGLPVLAPSIGCLPELLYDGGGMLYDPADRNGLLGAMKKLREADRDVLSAAARRRAVQLDWAAIGRQTAFFYHQCMQSNIRPSGNTGMSI